MKSRRRGGLREIHRPRRPLSLIVELLHFLQAGDQFLRQALFRLRPEQPGAAAAVFLNVYGELHQLGYVVANLGASLVAEGSLGLQKVGIETEVDLDVTRLLVSAFVEFLSLDDEFHSRRLEQPG